MFAPGKFSWAGIFLGRHFLSFRRNLLDTGFASLQRIHAQSKLSLRLYNNRIAGLEYAERTLCAAQLLSAALQLSNTRQKYSLVKGVLRLIGCCTSPTHWPPAIQRRQKGVRAKTPATALEDSL